MSAPPTDGGQRCGMILRLSINISNARMLCNRYRAHRSWLVCRGTYDVLQRSFGWRRGRQATEATSARWRGGSWEQGSLRGSAQGQAGQSWRSADNGTMDRGGDKARGPDTARSAKVRLSRRPDLRGARPPAQGAWPPYSVTISTSTLMPRRRPSGCSSSAMTTV